MLHHFERRATAVIVGIESRAEMVTMSDEDGRFDGLRRVGEESLEFEHHRLVQSVALIGPSESDLSDCVLDLEPERTPSHRPTLALRTNGRSAASPTTA